MAAPVLNLAAALWLVLLTGCASLSGPQAALAPLAADPRVLVEPGAESSGARVAALLDDAIAQVEATHYLPFAAPVVVHVCGTPRCFSEHVQSTHVSGATVPDNLVFLAPQLFDRETHRLPAILAHELSHLHLGQRLGHYTPRLPIWFHEGLAALASRGGGADYASDEDVRAAAAAGRVFDPATLDEEGRRHRAEHWHLTPHLFYRQAMLFLAALREESEARFRAFLLRIQAGEDFAASFADTYNRTLAEAGRRFFSGLVSKTASLAE